jgi:hypothetical protein
MARIRNLGAEQISVIEQSLGLKLPAEYARFVTGYPFADMTYMGAAELTELYEMNAALIIEANDALRDKTLNPFFWNEQWFAVGERSDEAVFYLDMQSNSGASPVYVLEPGAAEGMLAAESFAAFADSLAQDLLRRDRECIAWHERQKPLWSRLWRGRAKADAA